MRLGRYGIEMLDDFYHGQKVLVTGHTGFKGSWLCKMLDILGADVYGYSLEPPTELNLYNILNLDEKVHSIIGDITDFDRLSHHYRNIHPDIVIHMAAQPIVSEGYREPLKTFNTNIIGTANIMECVRLYGAKSVLNVTTDKVYWSDGQRPYREEDRLDGFDPYSNSKSCSDLVTHCYSRSFDLGCPVSTARAGNVIGGGDFAIDRIVPDCIRSLLDNKKITLRHPNSIRPYQLVLEPLYAYLAICKSQYENPKLAGSYNIGPDPNDTINTKNLVEKISEEWGEDLHITLENRDMVETEYLSLDNGKLKRELGISPMIGIDDAVRSVVEWTKVWSEHEDIIGCTESQIKDYLRRRGEVVPGQE